MDRVEIVRLNNEISKCASRKDLSSAVSYFKQLSDHQASNSHSYCSLINAYVMCGDISGARNVFDELSSHKRLRPDIISYTSMLKGYSRIGDVSSTIQLLNTMYKATPKIIPNVRTLNTCLRACIVAGCPTEASSIFTHMTKSLGLTPDVSSWEYLVILLSQQLAINRILPIIGRLKDDPTMLSGLGMMYISLARACAILADWKACVKALKQAVIFLDKNDAAESTIHTNIDTNTSSSSVVKDVTGGKRAWKASPQDNASREHSLSVYRDHRSAELRREVDRIDAYANNHLRGGDRKDIIFEIYKKVFSFSTNHDNNNVSDKINGDGLIDEIIKTRNEKFGFAAFHDKFLCGATVSTNKKRPHKDTDDELTVHLRRSISSSGMFNMDELFSPTSSSSSCVVKMEFGSGSGEWAVAQASAEAESSWCTVELRHDRVYETFSRAVFANLSNISIIRADALAFLPSHIRDSTLHHVFVNFPEPPQQRGDGVTTSQSKHLLTHEFFVQMSRVLRDSGLITILTDNQWYALYLLRYLSTEAPDKLSSRRLTNASYINLEERGRFICYEGTPGSDAGHSAEASSYFDRMWLRSEQPKRFFFVLEKSSSVLKDMNNDGKIKKRNSNQRKETIILATSNQMKNKKLPHTSIPTLLKSEVNELTSLILQL